MKKITFLLILLFFFLKGISQRTDNIKQEQITKLFTNSDYIAEGEFLRIKIVPNKDSTLYHTINVFKVFNVFKGSNSLRSGDTIEILSETHTEKVVLVEDHKFRPYKKLIGTVFFKVEQVGTYKYKLLNDRRAFFVSYKDYYLRNHDTSSIAAKGLYRNFKKLDDYYVYLKGQGLNVPSSCFTRLKNEKQRRITSDTLTPEEVVRNRETGKRKWDSAQQNMQRLGDEYILKKKVNLRLQDPDDITTFYFKNPSIKTVGTKSFLDFDVFISNNSSTFYYIQVAQFDLEYNGCQAFPCKIFENGAVTVTPGSEFSNYSVALNDKSDTRLNINIQSTYAPDVSVTNTYLDNTPKKLLHVSMQILNCGVASSLNLLEPENTAFDAVYTDRNVVNVGEGKSEIVDNTIHVDVFPFNTCEPIILSVNNSTNTDIIAGVGQEVSIKGWFFGSHRSNSSFNNGGALFFKDANEGGSINIELDDMDYKSWSDNEVKIILPSKVSENSGVPGTGRFQVRNYIGFQGTSQFDIDIKSAVTNVLESGEEIRKHRVYIGNLNNTSDIVFVLNRLVADQPRYLDIIANIEEVFNNWNCYLPFRLILKKDPASNLPILVDNTNSTSDGQNVISFTNFLEEGMETTSSTSLCTSTTPTDPIYKYRAYFKDNDIAILNGSNWSYNLTGDVNGLDFKQAFTHEVGHVLALAHIINPSELMHFELKPTGTKAENRINLESGQKIAVTTVDEIVVEESKKINWNDDCVIKRFQPTKEKVCIVGLNNENISASDFILSPNPFEGNSIAIQGKEASRLESYQLIDSQGIIVQKGIFNPNSSDRISIDNLSLNSGLYLLNTKTRENKGLNLKLIVK